MKQRVELLEHGIALEWDEADARAHRRRPPALPWLCAWVRAKKDARAERRALLERARFYRSAPRGYVPGPEPTEDDLDLLALEKYISTEPGRKQVALAVLRSRAAPSLAHYFREARHAAAKRGMTCVSLSLG
jgi:hypothetical protein